MTTTARLPSFAALIAAFDRAVHPSVCDDPLVRARHRSFIAAHVVGALLALLVFAVFFATIGHLTLYSSIACGWFLTPLLIALYVSRTGQLARAHFLSTANLIGLVLLAASVTGGIQSFAIIWMVVVPLEASLSASRRSIVCSSLAAMLALVGLYAATALGYVPPPPEAGFGRETLELFSHLAAAAYGGSLALNIGAIHSEAADAVRREHVRYRLLAENATDLISRHADNGRVAFASPASLRLTGEPPEALLGDGMLQRVLVPDRPAFLAALDGAAMGESTDVEFRLRRLGVMPDGMPGYFWAEMRCRPADAEDAHDSPSPADRRREVVAVTRDLSRRKDYEEQLLQARSAADSASRSKSLFLANMSHELRTPLNAIIGFAEIQMAELGKMPGHERWAEHATIIRDSGQQLLVMVNELLDISKIESGHYRIDPELVDLEEVASACRATLQPVLAKKNLSLTLDLPADLPEFEADVRCVRQMLINLLGNAIKFSPSSAPIRLEARCEDTRMVIRVVDVGIGIAACDIERLGQPFVQAAAGYDRQYEGTGLGLSLVKGMVRLHQGTFRIDSERGRGTTVILSLPMSQGGSSNRARSEPVDTLPVKKSEQDLQSETTNAAAGAARAS